MSAGRSCPLSYRYSPAVFRAPASMFADTLYVVGGLYGNEVALDTVLQMFAAEPGPARLVFNGDFNWFNIDSASFERINRLVLSFDAIRGNVETELGPQANASDAGCGCGYPEWVGDEVVERSNRIIAGLAATAAAFPALQQRLAALPMWLRADVGGVAVGIVHGDAESLAGWGFSREALARRQYARRLRDWFSDAGVRLFASSHTCVPVLHPIDDAQGRACGVANNGAAGMPNFPGSRYGLLTRIATTPYRGNRPGAGAGLFNMRIGKLFVDAVPIHYDDQRWQTSFLTQWPPGSAAHTSYWSRISEGACDPR